MELKEQIEAEIRIKVLSLVLEYMKGEAPSETVIEVATPLADWVLNKQGENK